MRSRQQGWLRGCCVWITWFVHFLPCANIDLLAFMIDMRLPGVPCMYVATVMCMVCGGIVVFIRLLVLWEDRAKVS
jgi:hypothetical protein